MIIILFLIVGSILFIIEYCNVCLERSSSKPSFILLVIRGVVCDFSCLEIFFSVLLDQFDVFDLRVT
jgi:hypothetical protein